MIDDDNDNDDDEGLANKKLITTHISCQWTG